MYTENNRPLAHRFEEAIANLDSSAHGCRLAITEIRREMDAACDTGRITLQQWRTLLERITRTQIACNERYCQKPASIFNPQSRT